MEIATFQTSLVTDFICYERRHDVDYGHDTDRSNRELIFGWVQGLPGRFSRFKWEELDRWVTLYKEYLAYLCDPDCDASTVFPSWDVTESLSPLGKQMLLGILSWPSKLTFLGAKPSNADINGFLERSSETRAFSDYRCLDTLFRPSDLAQIEYLTRPGSFRPKHGPGATFEKLRGWDKWMAVFDEASARPIARITSVPKDRHKSRLIAIEHARNQFMQQGLAASLRRTSWFRRYINLESQADHVAFANARLSTGEFKNVTIDLKDASDRISPALVEYLLPRWYRALCRYSSRYVSIPAQLCPGTPGGLYPLGMMANMGCGFCFELETLLFHLVATAAVRQQRGCSFISAARLVRVYGDDVIVPGDCYQAVASTFENLLGWRINRLKTAVGHSFRETCGHYIWSDPNVGPRRRLCPSLQTRDRIGASTAILFESGNQVFALATLLAENGFARSAALVVNQLAGTPVRFRTMAARPSGECHQVAELLYTCPVEVTRPLSVTEETRYLAYWLCGLQDQVEESCDRIQFRPRWEPVSHEMEAHLRTTFPQFGAFLASADAELRRPLTERMAVLCCTLT